MKLGIFPSALVHPRQNPTLLHEISNHCQLLFTQARKQYLLIFSRSSNRTDHPDSKLPTKHKSQVSFMVYLCVA